MTRRRLQIAAAAEEEARAAFLWYSGRSEEAARRFQSDLVAAMERIQEGPLTGCAIDGDVRRMMLSRFPYAVLYTGDSDRIIVLAVMHLRRRPGYWRHR